MHNIKVTKVFKKSSFIDCLFSVIRASFVVKNKVFFLFYWKKIWSNGILFCTFFYNNSYSTPIPSFVYTIRSFYHHHCMNEGLEIFCIALIDANILLVRHKKVAELHYFILIFLEFPPTTWFLGIYPSCI